MRICFLFLTKKAGGVVSFYKTRRCRGFEWKCVHVFETHRSEAFRTSSTRGVRASQSVANQQPARRCGSLWVVVVGCGWPSTLFHHWNRRGVARGHATGHRWNGRQAAAACPSSIIIQSIITHHHPSSFFIIYHHPSSSSSKPGGPCRSSWCSRAERTIADCDRSSFTRKRSNEKNIFLSP